MAEGFLKHYTRDRFEVYSAGLEPAPQVHPLAVQVMKEAGVDISGQHPKGVTAFLGKLAVQTLIIVCDNAEKNCPSIWPGAWRRLHWSLEDPVAFVGDDAAKLGQFRKVRDQIDTHIKKWIADN
jgi:arsenate reductase